MVKQCPTCRTLVELSVQTCPGCHHFFTTQFPPPQTQAFYPPPQPPVPIYAPAAPPGMISAVPGTHPATLAIILSVFFGPWAGAIINRQVAKGLVIYLVCAGILAWFTCGLAMLLIWPIGLIDTVVIANKLNRGETVGEWQFF